MRTTVKIAYMQIPFKRSFSHASATRSISENVLLEIVQQGVTGCGECCPRNYVSGENLQTVENSLRSPLFSKFFELTSLCQVQYFLHEKRTKLDIQTAALCAAEMGLLDCLSRQNNKPVEELMKEFHSHQGALEHVDLEKPTIVIGLESLPQMNQKILKYTFMGFQHFKIKVTADTDLLHQLLRQLSSPIANFVRRLGGSFRIDGNNCFSTADEVLQKTEKLKDLIVGIEEPLLKTAHGEQELLLLHSEIPIILDDSIICLQDLQEALVFSKNKQIIPNIRLSKNGGLFRSLELVEFCQKNNLNYILGSQVGESSLLTRAGLALISLAAKKPIYYEGAFSSHLLSVDPWDRSLKLTFGGKIKNAEAVLKKPGWGLKLAEEIRSSEFLSWQK